MQEFGVFFIVIGVYKMFCVKGCLVRKVLFPMGKSGWWFNDAYVILSSAEDIVEVLTNENKLWIGTKLITGKY